MLDTAGRSFNLQSFLLRCGTRRYESVIELDSNSFVKVCYSTLLTIIPTEVHNTEESKE